VNNHYSNPRRGWLRNLRGCRGEEKLCFRRVEDRLRLNAEPIPYKNLTRERLRKKGGFFASFQILSLLRIFRN
jgi:hypothetical protein